MLIVTGTFRSGTSMWMQILSAAGFAVIGEKFPRVWGDVLNAANEDGFFESELVGGVYYRTNPHPASGTFLFPEDTRAHAVKVFIPGLIRTDLAYIDRVIATVREWKQYVRSAERLQGIVGHGVTAVDPAQDRLPLALQWWSENFALIRDIATRQYPVHVTSYQRLLDEPEREIREVLGWIGAGEVDSACRAVHHERQTQHPRGEGDHADIEPRHVEVFDELCAHVTQGHAFSASFVEKLNETDQQLRPVILDFQARAKLEAARSLTIEGSTA